MRKLKHAWGLVLAMLPSLASPCEAIGKDGKPVRIASETAIIVWNSKKHEESFIRLANFETPPFAWPLRLAPPS